MGIVMTAVVLSPGVIVEHVGGELLVVVRGHTDVVKLTGGVREMLEDIRAGKSVDVSDPVVVDLLELGIVSTPGVSRRGLIKAGAIGAGAGIAVLAMPGVAAASSSNEENDDSDAETPPLQLIFLGIFGGLNEPAFEVTFASPLNRFDPGGPVTTVTALLTNDGQAPVETRADWTSYSQSNPTTWQIRMNGPGRTVFSLANTVRIEIEFTYDNVTYSAVYEKAET